MTKPQYEEGTSPIFEEKLSDLRQRDEVTPDIHKALSQLEVMRDSAEAVVGALKETSEDYSPDEYAKIIDEATGIRDAFSEAQAVVVKSLYEGGHISRAAYHELRAAMSNEWFSEQPEMADGSTLSRSFGQATDPVPPQESVNSDIGIKPGAAYENMPRPLGN